MPRFKVKAFDPHNPDAKARSRWDQLQRGETKHRYDLPPTQPGKRSNKGKKPSQPSSQQSQSRDDERPTLTQRRFQAQILAAKGVAVRKPNSGPDTELRDRKALRKANKAKAAKQRQNANKNNDDDDDEDDSEQQRTNKRQRTQHQSDEQREAEAAAEEQQTRRRWEEKAAAMTGQRSKASSAADTAPVLPPSPPAREFEGVEKIPFGFQVDRPPQHLPQLKNKRATALAASQAGKVGGGLTMEQYAAERQKAQEAYAEMRKRRREAEKT